LQITAQGLCNCLLVLAAELDVELYRKSLAEPPFFMRALKVARESCGPCLT
jgi:hypothetical protein